jgi:hypothetical protein
LDWQAGAWVLSPLLETASEAREWQRAENARVERDQGDPTPGTSTSNTDDEARRSEQLFWWAFCYVGLGFVGVALALFLVDIGG